MKRRLRIISTSISIVLVAALLSIGIFAATTAKVNGNANIAFSATDIFATVTIEQTAPGATTKTAVSFDGVFNGATAAGEASTTKTATLGDITFNKADEIYKLEITVKNDFQSTQAITAALTASVKNGETDVAGVIVQVSPTATIAAQGNATVAVIVSIDPNSDVAKTGMPSGAKFAFELTLTKA